MLYFFLILIFLFGAALGSFVLVIANRYNTGLPFFKGRSLCFSCNTKLQKKDLAPIFSFLFLRGRCRYCQSKIPVSMFWAEIIMGILVVLAAYKSGIFDNFQFIFQFSILTLIFGTILLISIYDLRHFIIPDSFLIFLFILAFLHNSLFIIYHSLSYSSIFDYFFSSITLAIPFLLIFLISKGLWLGFGDVKYILVLGFLLGFSQGLSAIILAFWIGAAFSLTALFLRHSKPHINLPLFGNNFTIKSEIPFGPFLSVGIIISFYLNAGLFQIHSLFGL